MPRDSDGASSQRWCCSPRGALFVSAMLFFSLFMIFADLRSGDTPSSVLEGDSHRTVIPGHTLRPTPVPDEVYVPQPQATGGDNNNDNVMENDVTAAPSSSSATNHHPFRDARLVEAARSPLDPDLTEWPHEDELLDRPLYNVSKKPSKSSKFVSHLEFKGKCWYEVTNFCVVQGDLVLYHDPATDRSVRRDSLRMCNEFSQRSSTIRLKYRSEPTPDVLPGPLLHDTPGWVLQFWCQDLFHSTLSLMPAYQTRLKYFSSSAAPSAAVSTSASNNNNVVAAGGGGGGNHDAASTTKTQLSRGEPDVYLRIARGIRKKGQYCHIKFGHPLSFNESHNKRWGGDKQFPFAGNPYWKMYKALTADPWRIHPLYSGSTKKTACYRTGVIDKLYVKHVTRRMARDYSDAQLRNLEVPPPAPRECGKYRVTIIDRRGKTRRLTNIDNIVEIAKSRVPGFAVVRAAVFEHLSLQEQIGLIANTDVLLGMHGNGLTWQQFMQQGSCLIELCHTWYMPYAKLFGHAYFHSSLRHNPTYKKQGEYVPFAHNETEIEELLRLAKAALDRTSCGPQSERAQVNMDEQLDYMYKDCAPHC